MHFISQMNQLE